MTPASLLRKRGGAVSVPDRARSPRPARLIPRQRGTDRPTPPVCAGRYRRGAAIGLGLFAVATASWLGTEVFLVHHELGVVAADVTRVRSAAATGDVAAARGALADLGVHARRAQRLSSGPVWSLANHVPVAGPPLRAVAGMAALTGNLSRDAVIPLLTSTADLDLNRIRLADGRIDVDRIATLAPAVHRVALGFATAQRAAAALPAGTGIPALDQARTRLITRLGRVVDDTAELDRLVRLAPAMLGRGGARNYLLVFQNESEARGTGGLPGAFAMGSVVDGRITFTHMDSDRVLAGVATNLELGKDYDLLYGTSGTEKLSGNANLSPHFPYAAQIWTAMWQRRFGQSVDGVIALDPTVLSYLLRAIGPALLPDGTSVGADDVVALTQQTAYARFPGLDNAADVARRQFLVDIEHAVVQRITALHGQGPALLRALGQAATERRLLVWSAHPAEETELMATPVAGAVPVTDHPYVGLSIVNDGGNKLDYYLDRSLTWERTGCPTSPRERVTITLTNNAPAAGLSPLVTMRSDDHPYPVAPGDNRLLVNYLATTGARLESATLDGARLMVGSGDLLGHPTLTMDVELPHGSTRRIVLNFVDPRAAGGAPVVLRQPLVRPLAVQLLDACAGAG